MKIDRANKKQILESSDLPDVSSGVTMFFQTIKIDLVKKTQVDGYTQEKTKCIVTQGVRQPFNSSQLQIKPEAERTWNWSKLYCLPDVNLELDDIAKIRGIKYRVMAQSDWAEYGYVEYDLCEDYRHVG